MTPQPLPSAGASDADEPQALARSDPESVAPPPDVLALLQSEHSTLPFYYDAQRVQAGLASQRDWPRLWQLTGVPP